MCVITTQMLITCTGPKPNAPNAAHRNALRTPQLSVPHSSAAVLCAQQSSDICSHVHIPKCASIRSYLSWGSVMGAPGSGLWVPWG